MKRTVKNFWKSTISCILIIAITGCSLTIEEDRKDSVLSTNVKTAVSRIIDEEMECIKPNLEPDLQASIDGKSAKGRPLNGKEIVDLTMNEDKGENYVDFCFQVNKSSSSLSSEDVLESASEVLPETEYLKLRQKALEVEKRIKSFGDEYVKGIPEDQQEAFFKDLKTLVVRSVVLLTAGIVYAVMPNTVFWGKVSAAAAISVGAGMVAVTIMSIYQYFKFGPGEKEQTFEDWFKDLLEIPKAEFALTTAVTALGNSFEKGPVVTGILMCVFGVFKATDLIRAMLKTYNFSA